MKKTLRTQLTTVTSSSALALCLSLVPATRAANHKPADHNQDQPRPLSDYTTNRDANATRSEPKTDNFGQDAADRPATTAIGAERDTTKPVDATPPADTAARSSTMAARADTSITMADESIQVATEDAQDRSDRKLAGRKVEGSDGKDLGNIKDFLIDPASGRVTHAIISTGGIGGIGDKLRLVPINSLKAGAKEKEFRVNIDKASWDQISALPADAFKSYKYTLTDSERRQIEQRFGADAAAGAAYTSELTAQLIRASDLHRKDVRSGNENIGSLEGVVIDLPAGTAMALLDPKRDFAGSNQKFLVPLKQFSFSGQKDAAVTTLNRAQFQQAAGAGRVSSSSSGALPVASTDTSAQATTATTSTSTAPSHAATDQSATSQTQVSTNVGATNTDTTATGIQASVSGQHAGDQKPDLGLSGTASVSQSTTVSTDQSTIARSSSSTAPSPATSTSDQSLTMTGRATTTQSDTTTQVATDTSKEQNSQSTIAQTDAQSQLSPSFKSEQGQDIATANPPSPSSKSPGADRPMTSDTVAATAPSTSSTTTATASTDASVKSDSTSTQQQSAGLAASSSPARSSDAEAKAGDQSKSSDIAANATSRSTDTSATSNQVAANDQGKSTTATPSVTTNTRANEPELTPTGRNSADQTPATNDPSLVSAALAARKALDDDVTLAKLDVAVTPENGKLVLRGSVTSDELKKDIEKAVEEAASGQEIESKISVERQ